MQTVGDILKNTALSLPVVYEDNELFEEFIEKQLCIYIDEIKKIVLPKYEQDFIQSLTEVIPKVIEQYFLGNPSKSFTILSNLFNSTNTFTLNFPKYQYANRSSFFRIRSKTYLTDKPLQRSELFHHPFEQRGKVSTQRYSIPGFPCLYVGDSMYVCWEELNRPDLRKVQAVRFENNGPMSVFNIDFSIYGNPQKIEKLNLPELRSYLLLWPLFAVCSIEIPDNRKNDPFKPEYIFPQLLLQFLIPILSDSLKSGTMNEIIGIQYNSTRINKALYQNKSNSFFNLVLPPLYEIDSITPSGHSNHLKRLFNMTEVVDIGSRSFEIPNLDSKSKVETVELFKGIHTEYIQSELGQIEQYLYSLPATQIDLD